jgi:hypothetical protein
MSTVIKVSGVEYDMGDAFSKPELNALMFLKQHENLSLADVYQGFQTLAKTLNAAAAKREAYPAALAAWEAAPGESGEPVEPPTQVDTIMEMLSNIELLNTFRGLVWLLKTSGGSRAADGRYLTVEAANVGVSFDDIEFPEDEEEPPANDVPDPSQAGEVAPPS